MIDCKCVVPCVNGKNQTCGHCGGFFKGFQGEIDTPPMPKVKAPKPEGTISTHRSKAMDVIIEALGTAKETYQDAIKKGSTVTCGDIVRNIRELTGILKSLEANNSEDTPVRKEVISIQAGDLVTISTDERLTAAQADHAFKIVLKSCPKANVIFLDNGMTLEVYREQVGDQSEDECPCQCQTCSPSCVHYRETETTGVLETR